MEIWEFVQVQIAMYIDGNLPGLGRDSQFGRVMRGFCQRLKGKQGRFRGNLSGKRFVPKTQGPYLLPPLMQAISLPSSRLPNVPLFNF